VTSGRSEGKAAFPMLVRAFSTLIWVCWVSFLVSVFGLIAFLLFLAARSLLT
jgi:hypothetical protein